MLVMLAGRKLEVCEAGLELLALDAALRTSPFPLT